MSLPAIKPAEPVEPLQLSLPADPAQPSVVAIDGVAPAWAESPARILHDRLVQSFAAPAPDDSPLLPARVRVAILLGSVTLLWSAIGGVVFLLI